MNFVLNKKYYVLFEQGIMSLMNFGLIFLLSKLITPILFKNFFLEYSVIIILTLITSTFSNQPLQIFLSKKDNNIDYIKKVIGINISLLFFLMFFVFFAGKIYYDFLLDDIFPIFVLSLVISIYDLIRRFSFVYFQNNFLINVFSTFSVVCCFLILLITNYYYGVISSVGEIFWFLISAHLIGIVFFLLFKSKELKKLFAEDKSKATTSIFKIVEKHKSYSLWLVFGIIFFWNYTQGIYFIAEKYVQVDDFNVVRVSQSLVGVLSVFFVTFENVMLTKTALIFDGTKFLEIKKFVKKIIKENLLKLIGLVLVLGLIVGVIYKFYYGNNESYLSRMYYLLYFFIYQFIFGISRVFVVAVKAMNQTKFIFYSHLITSIFTTILGVLFLKEFNNGNTLAMIILTSILTFSVVVFIFYNRFLNKKLSLNGES